ncbi:MAG: hypothetical protein OEL53_15965 [Rhodospirillales bacterium]|nr:hypothetical protein [Rhodospirillales bacterium]
MDRRQEQHDYWPGFVDALSNVVLTLVFVLVVIVFALVISSSKVQQKAIELAHESYEHQQQKQTAEAEMLDLRRELREAMKALQDSQALVAELKKQLEALKSSDPAKETKGPTQQRVKIAVAPRTDKKAVIEDSEIDQNVGVIVVTFPIGVFELSEKAKEELLAALAPYKDKLEGTQPALRSVQGAESYSEGKRLAYFRGLSVRNFLIDKNFGTGRTISVMLDQEAEVGDGRVEIRFRRR